MTDVANTGDGENRLRPRSQPNQEVVRAAPRLTGCVLHQRRLPDARVAAEYGTRFLAARTSRSTPSSRLRSAWRSISSIAYRWSHHVLAGWHVWRT
jgi:hypothetical protein